MPLRDHFRSPLNDTTSWEGFHAQWPAMLVLELCRKLPPEYVAAPQVHLGAMVEIDIATYERDMLSAPSWDGGPSDGGVATAVWAPPSATLSVESDLPAQDDYEVLIYDTRRGRRLVAAIELVSPGNKDRAENRRAFVTKCAQLLREQVSVIIVDLVTTRHFNLYHELLEWIDQTDPALGTEPPDLYAVACRATRRQRTWSLDTWLHPLTLGAPLPTLPLWLAPEFAIPLDLEPSYEETCRVLRLPG